MKLGGKPPAPKQPADLVLAEFEEKLEEFEFVIDLFEAVIMTYGVETTAAQPIAPQESTNGPSPYVAATALARHIGTCKHFKTFLYKHPEIPTRRPARNRLEVYAAEFHRVLQAEANATFTASDIAQAISDESEHVRYDNRRIGQ